MPTPAAKRSTVPYECRVWWPYGPSRKHLLVNRPPGAASALRNSFSVKPVRLRMMKEMVWAPDLRGRSMLDAVADGDDVAPMSNPFSISARAMGLFLFDSASTSDDHAIENGCEVHQPVLGIYRYACAPVWKVHGRAIRTVTRTASPGSASTSAVVPPCLTLPHRIRTRRIPRSDAHKARVILTMASSYLYASPFRWIQTAPNASAASSW